MRYILQALSIFLVLPFHFAYAQDIKCSCNFVEGSGYSAFGTREVCSAFTKIAPGRRTCEIAFGGRGADADLISRSGLNPADYTSNSYRLTLFTLGAVQNGRLADISSPEYLQQAIPLFLRAAYLRDQSELSAEELKVLEGITSDIAAKLTPLISDIFLGKQDPKLVELGSSQVEVHRGSLLVTYQDRIRLVVVFFNGS